MLRIKSKVDVFYEEIIVVVMALSQKHSGKILVPWYSSHEWKYVYSLIYSETSTQSDKKKALEILQIWKIRMPILFAGLEGTLIILNAMLHDGTTFTKDQLSSFYALAIMRFLNLCAANSDQQGTFFRIAKERNLPEWLVSIRHDLAHSQKQSSLFMLRKGIEYCFEWLKYEYWELQDRKITDFLVSTVTSDDIEDKIHLYTIEQIPNLYVVKWEPVFQYLSDYNMLMNIILKLHEICCNNEDLLIEKISSLWLKEIFAGLSTNVIINSFYTNIISLHVLTMVAFRKQFIIVAASTEYRIYHEFFWVLRILKVFCLLDRCLSLTYILFDPLFKFQPCITEVSHGVVLVLKISGRKRANLVQELSDFAFVIHINDRMIMRCRILILSLKITLLENVKEAIGVDTFEGLSFTVDRTLPTPPKNWTKIEDTCNYEGCPIGILPYQSRDRNPTISF
ncbi:hypothetical protein MML48_1g05889 [Holotrichia oblita]|uniref:Uncharacterized protein n=1 Tax=Holotrichia oblita TaxID=644536 RepID=A0ACB9TV10_HOLOL|nr:hypothetical protein MML48_1g05889 [Holotrichia oblita]